MGKSKQKRISDQFRTAALGSGMTELEVSDVIISIFEGSCSIHSREDEIRGVFLALEQMLSKGKVMTEELRRELGVKYMSDPVTPISESTSMALIDAVMPKDRPLINMSVDFADPNTKDRSVTQKGKLINGEWIVTGGEVPRVVTDTAENNQKPK